MLRTNLTHVLSEQEHAKLLQENENVMVCCGRMGPMCIPVYEVMEELENEYPHVKFADMEFDIPDARVIRDLPECRNFAGLPFVVYYKNGKVVKATSSIQSREQITSILDQYFGQEVKEAASK
ncbi:thioredoxin family protein [Ignavibacterium sp.]|uniref:thioredoxin family protein n=1 Tax=Ignavibacterium sp. TaxID=2651167 RepID=UPI0025C3EA5A|nr:thioredoxin family protein [Ignavibacterium sp.]